MALYNHDSLCKGRIDDGVKERDEEEDEGDKENEESEAEAEGEFEAFPEQKQLWALVDMMVQSKSIVKNSMKSRS